MSLYKDNLILIQCNMKSKDEWLNPKDKKKYLANKRNILKYSKIGIAKYEKKSKRSQSIV